MEKLEKIEMRNIVPIAAMISAGKSKLLNVILNVNFLESKSGIGTKFVNILRYNPKIEQPLFYHLKLKAEKGKYIFYKDNEYKIIQGEKNIIEENIAINKELADKKKINYDDIFYITEINSIGFLKFQIICLHMIYVIFLDYLNIRNKKMIPNLKIKR